MANEDNDFSVQIRKTRLGGLARRVVDQSIMDREAALNHLALAHDNDVSFLTQAIQAMPDKKAALYRMTAEEYGMPLFDLRTLNLTDRPADLVTPQFIDEHQVLPIFHRGSKVFVAVGEPGEQAGLDAFKFQTGLGVEPILVDATVLQESIEKISGDLALVIWRYSMTRAWKISSSSMRMKPAAKWFRRLTRKRIPRLCVLSTNC